MPPGTASEPKRHHYVPRFYLQRFADPQGKLSAYDRQSSKTITTKPTALAAENDFYRLPDDARLPPMALENAFSSQEGDAARAIRDTVSAGYVSQEDRQVLALHVALQLARTRRERNFMRDLAQLILPLQEQVELNEKLSTNAFESDAARKIAEDRIGKLVSGETDTKVDKKILLGLIFEGLSEVQSVLLSGWNWILITLSEPKFLTSDHPICMLGEPEPGAPTPNVGVATALEIWFPLDPRHALVLSRDHSVASPLSDLANGHIRRINLRLALESERWSFFHPRSRGVKGFQIPRDPPGFVDDTIGRRSNPDDTTSEFVVFGLKRPHVPNEQLLSGRPLRRFP